MRNSWFFAQRVKISELKSAQKLNFSARIWKLTSFFLLIIQLCKNLSANHTQVLFVDNFFINVKLFKALKIINIETCQMTKVESKFSTELIRLRAAATKKKHWRKMRLMITSLNKKMNIKNENVLCMIWIDLNIVQYMIIMHIIDEMKQITYKNSEKRHEILKSSENSKKLSFFTSIVEYNTYIRESDENAQKKLYYSFHRFDKRYWWLIFIFFMKAIVLNAYKLWDLFYFDLKITHLEFQHRIVETLLTSFD